MAAQKPTIATDGAGIRKMIVDDYNGFLTNNAIEDISHRILCFRRNAHKVKAFGATAYASVLQRFSIHSAIRTYQKVFLDEAVSHA